MYSGPEPSMAAYVAIWVPAIGDGDGSVAVKVVVLRESRQKERKETPGAAERTRLAVVLVVHNSAARRDG